MTTALEGQSLPLGISVPSGALLQRLTTALLGAYFVTIPVVRVGLIPVGPTFVQLSDLLFALTAVVWGAAVLKRVLPLPPVALIVPTALLFIAALISMTGSANVKTSVVKLVGLAYLIGVSWVTASVARHSLRGFAFALAAFITGASVTGLFGTLSAIMFYAGIRDRSINVFLWNSGSVPTGNYPRIVVFFMNANMLCSYLLIGLGAIAMLLPFVRKAIRTWLLIACIPMAITCLFTLSTGLGGIGLLFAVVWIWRQASAKSVKLWREGPLATGAITGAVGLALITIFLMVPAGKGDVRLGPIDLSFETSGRVAVWKSAAETFATHPARGVGIGMPAAVTDHPRALNTTEQLGTARERKGPMPFEAHNVWLNVAAQLGIVGIVAFIWLNFRLLRDIWPKQRASAMGGAFQVAEVAAVATWIAAVGYHGLFGAFEDSRHYWVFFGFLAALHSLATHLRETSELPAPADASSATSS
jgi:O-antigen ligase